MADLKISIGIVNETKAGVSSVKSELRGVGDEAEKTGRRVSTLAKPDFSSAIKAIKEYGSQIQNLGQRFTSYGQTLALSLSAPIAAVAALGVKFNSTKEQSITAFSVLLKDGEKAKKLYSELQDFADATPFEAPEVVESGRKLLAAKVPLEEIKGYLKDIGDLAAGTRQNITDVAGAFTRIKAGDFGEAFERLRDFGIARKDLEAEGLKFDKGGQYLGSVEQAMKAVRAIVQRDFGGMMEEQSKTFSGRVSTILDTLNRSLGDLFEPLFNAISDGLPTVIEFVTKVKNFIGGLSEPAKIAVTVFLGIAAAIAPVLLILGSIISFFAPIVSGFISVAGAVAAAGGTMALLTTGFAAVTTFVTATLIPALTTILPVVAGVVAVFAVVAAAAVALYAAWQVNFGGIKTYTLEAWAFIKSAVQTGITYIYSIIQSVGGQIVGWWRENYPLIRQIVENVSNSIKTTVGAFLETVRQFWQNHGENIFDYVKTYYGYIKSIVGQVIGQLGTIIRFGLQVLTGDWSGAWQSFLQIVKNASKILTTIFYAIKDIFIKFLSAVIPILIEYGVKFGTTLATYIGKAVVGAVYILATLPQRLLELVPKLIMAGASIGAAIWQGIKDGIAGNASNNPITIDIPAPNVAPPDVPQEAGQAAKTVASAPSLDTGKLAQDATRLKETREALAKAELSAQIGLFSNQADEIKGIYDKAFGEIVDKFKESNNSAQFESDFQALKEWYGTEIGTLAPLWDKLVEQQILSEKKGNFERELALKEHQKKIQEFSESTFAKDAEVQKLITANVKKETDERTKNATDAIKTLQDAKNQIYSSGQNERFSVIEQTKILEEQISKGRELNEIETQEIKNKIELYKYESELRRLGKSDTDIATLTQLLAAEQAKTLELQKQLGITKQQKAVQDAIADEDKRIKDERIKQAEEMQKQYKETYDFIRGALDVLTDSGKSFGEKMKSIFGGIFQSFKKMILDMTAQWLSSKLFGLGTSSGGDNQGNGIFSFLKNLFNRGGSPSSGGSVGGTAPFNPNNPFAFLSGGSGSLAGVPRGNPVAALQAGLGSNGSSNGGFGSIFGSQGFGNNVGTYGAIGAGASIIGSLIGGRVGGFISGAGSGLGIGASIGSMIAPGIGTAIGAGIGALAGGLISLFGGDPKRKKDKKENLPALNKGFTDALAQLRALGADKNAFYNDPESVIAKALEIRGQIASGFGIQFLSKKYTAESKTLIASKLVEADSIIAELNKLKNRALRARDIDAKLQTSFATGVYLRDDQMGEMQRALDFKRRNGMLAGNFTGIDNLPSLLAQGEMVLNPMQIQQVILNSGGDDPFRDAGIPGYSTGTYIAPPSPAAPTPAPSVNSSSSQRNEENQPITIQLVLNNSGMVKSDIEDVLINGLKKSNVQVEVVNAYDKGKLRAK